MADEQDFSVAATPSLTNLATFLSDELFDVHRLARIEQLVTNAIGKGAAVAEGTKTQAIGGLAEDSSGLVELLEKFGGGLSGFLLSLVVEHTFEVSVDNAAFAKLGATSGRRAVARAISGKIVESLTGGNTSIQPSAQPAANYLSVILGQVLESWGLGELVEIGTALFPGMEKVEHIADLGDKLVNAMGFSDSSARVLRPYIDNLVVEPLRRYIAQTYRPNLLGEGEIVRAFQRGDYTGSEAADELAQLGWSDRRQDLLIKSAAKRLSLDDVLTLVREGTIDRDYALQNLRDEGYDDATAHYAVVAAESKRQRSLLDDSLAAVNNAYINRDLTDAEFRTFLPGILADETERGIHETTARTRRDLNVKHLSHGEVLDCVELAILPTAYYRAWLKREGYPDDEATALELRLIAKLSKEADLVAERKRIDEERAAEKAARAQEKKDRLAALEAERALHARGSISDLTRAVVRGLISLDRLAEVLRASYDNETVGILVSMAEADRVAYVGQQEAAKNARQRATNRQIDVGALEQGVLTGVLTIAQFRAALSARQFTAGDIDILSATLEARKQDADDARAKRAQAERDAKVKHIDLGRAERLVRRGAHSFAEYDALLQSLGYDDGSRAAMVELVRLEAADDAEARQLRDAAQKKAATKGLTLEQFRRAVLLNVRTVDDFGSYLAREGYTSDAASVLLAELRRDVADADAARLRRIATAATGGAVGLAFARVTQAARLGEISPAAYRARLERAGWTPDDITIEMDLLLVEIADTQAARARRIQLAGTVDQAKALSLAQLEHAVKLGTATMADYQSAAAAIYAPADVDLLVATLQAELDALATAAERHATIDGELTARQLSIGQVEAAVKAGALSLLEYRDRLITWGYGLDDAELLTALLANQVDRAGGSA